MSDFEFDIELLISLVEAGPVLWVKSDDIYRQDRNKRYGQQFVLLFR
jgi:hypothetical protein